MDFSNFKKKEPLWDKEEWIILLSNLQKNRFVANISLKKLIKPMFFNYNDKIMIDSL